MNYDTHIKQIVLGVLAGASLTSSGMTLAFPSVALPAMEVSASRNKGTLQDDHAFWIVGLPQISMVVGCLSAGPILDWRGRRFSLLLSNLVALSGWFLMALVPDLWSVLTGRLLTGFAMGFVNPVFLVYVSEIAAAEIRSGLTVVSSITFSAGITLTNIFGYFYRVDWRTVSWMCGIFPAVCFLLMLFILPEPKLWNFKTESPKRKFMRPEVYKPMIIMITAMIFRQLSGSNVILSYTVEIAQQVEGMIDSYLVAVLVGVTKTVGAVLAVWLCAKLGRRHPSVWSGLAMSICMLALAASFQLPTLTFIAYILTSTVNASSTHSMVAEVFPTDVRGIATSVTSVSIFLAGFLAVWIHQWLRKSSFVLFVYYGSMGIVSTLFLFFFLPETHGKTLKEIELMFNKNLTDEPERSLLDPSKQGATNYSNKT